MPLFSQRKGIKPLEKAIQREAVDNELRNRLWNALKLAVWDNYRGRDAFGYMLPESVQVTHLAQRLWHDYYKEALDTMPDFRASYGGSAYDRIRNSFFAGEWWEAYDFLEFIAKNSPDEWAAPLIEMCNNCLKTENSAYRFVGNEIVEITNEHEVAAIETALDTSTRECKKHLARALELLSDRQNPDYRNSIKESISAVEALCQTVTEDKNGTLGNCLKLLKGRAPIHPALEAAFGKLYGYTSDSGGIRHALTDAQEEPAFSEAKFMLVACSAFTSFLMTKAAENGLKLGRN